MDVMGSTRVTRRKWLTCGECGRVLGYDRTYIWRLVKSGKLDGVKIGGRYYIPMPIQEVERVKE